MTLAETYAWLAQQPLLVALVVGLSTILIGAVAAALRLGGAAAASQQVANVGIAVGLASVLVEGLAIVYAVTIAGSNPVTDAPIAFLLLPVWLLVSGAAIEHFLHPSRQEAFRGRVRALLLSVVAVGVLLAIFSVLKIYMLVFTSMWGFLLFIGALIGLFWFLLRRWI